MAEKVLHQDIFRMAESIREAKVPKKRGGGSFLIQKVILQISLYTEDIFDSKSVPNKMRRRRRHSIPKKLQYDFPKMRGGVKGCLELFRKFIRFGDAICA